MKEFVVLLCCLAGASGFVLSVDEEEVEWQAWKAYHGKMYATDSEETARKTIWRDNLEKIVEHNSQGHSWQLAMNHFGDLTVDEFRFLYLGTPRDFTNETETTGSTYMEPSHVTLPDEVDWRKEGYVTPVKNQGQCGSCWAFAVTGSLEGQHFKKTGNLVSLSEQNLVDCSRKNRGCNGGWPDRAFDYIKDNGGIDTEASYPYVGRQGRCRFNRRNVGAYATGYVDIARGNETALQSATATVGPISVGMDASKRSFQFYSSGIYNPRFCSSTRLDHGVLVVGYGSQRQDYWLVKNSWGARWGMEGYFMLPRNDNNKCGVATMASYPLV